MLFGKWHSQLIDERKQNQGHTVLQILGVVIALSTCFGGNDSVRRKYASRQSFFIFCCGIVDSVSSGLKPGTKWVSPNIMHHTVS